MKFTDAITETIQIAKQEGRLTYLYRNGRGWFVSSWYWHDWLFRAYPGGRTELSADGTKILEKIQEKNS